MINKMFLLLPPILKAYEGLTVCLIKIKNSTIREFVVQCIPNQERQLPPQHPPPRHLVQVQLWLFSTPPSLMNHMVQHF
jgi:hypothetical protein